MANHIKYHLLPSKPFLLLKKGKGDPVVAATHTLLKTFSLKHVTRVDFSFDPFHHSVSSIRDLIYYLSAKRIRASNEKCSIRTSIGTNREDPEIKLHLENGKELVYKTENLSALEILEHWNKYTSNLAPVQEKPLHRFKLLPEHYGIQFKKSKPDSAPSFATQVPVHRKD